MIDSIRGMEATGQEINCDGEQRSLNFAIYPLLDASGSAAAENLEAGGLVLRTFADGRVHQLPRLTRGPFRYKTFAADYLARSKPHFTGHFKAEVVAPSLLWLLYPLDGEIAGYPRAQFEADLVEQCEHDIRRCFALGATNVCIRFTEGCVACLNDTSNEWTCRQLLPYLVHLNNRLLQRFAPEHRRHIGVHVGALCDGDYAHSIHLEYAALLPHLFDLDAGYFLVQVQRFFRCDRLPRCCSSQ